jgi:ubiquinone biosynthesis protein COQ9
MSSTVDRAYNYVETMTRAQNTMQNMVKQGRVQDAQEFAAKYSAQIGQAGFANTVRKQLGSFAQMKRQIAMAPGMSAQEKRAAIEKINAASEQYARQANESFRSMAAAAQ